MAGYSYKELCYDEEFQRMVTRWEAECNGGEECDHDANYSGDYWYVAAFMVAELRARLAAAEKVRDERRQATHQQEEMARKAEAERDCQNHSLGQSNGRLQYEFVAHAATQKRLAEAEGLLRKNRRDFEMVTAPIWQGHPFTQAIREIDAFLANRPGDSPPE